MWLFLYVGLLVWAWLHSLLYGRIHLFVMASVVYAMHYFLCVYNVSDPRPWPWFRGWRLWDLLRQKHLGGPVWAEGGNWTDYESKGPRVFLVSAAPYDVLAMVLTFGLHGQEPKAVKDMSPLLVLPDHLFRYPLLANVLQWAGGVPYDHARLERVIKEDGVSLVMVLASTDDDQDAMERGERAPDTVAADWLVTLPQNTQQTIKVVPVWYHGTEHFYLHPLPFLQLGLFCSCLPLSVRLRAGVSRAVLLAHGDTSSSVDYDNNNNGDDGLIHSSVNLLETVRKAYSYMANLMMG